jgi:hypothetical protein
LNLHRREGLVTDVPGPLLFSKKMAGGWLIATIPPMAQCSMDGHPLPGGGCKENSCGLGDGMGGEADFSTALLTKCVSSFGRNDGSVDLEEKGAVELEEKTDNGKSKCKDEMRGFFPIRLRSGSE